MIEIDARFTWPVEVVGTVSSLLSLATDSSVTVDAGVCVDSVGLGEVGFLPNMNLNVDESFRVAAYSLGTLVSFPLKLMESLSLITLRQAAPCGGHVVLGMRTKFGFSVYSPSTSNLNCTSCRLMKMYYSASK